MPTYDNLMMNQQEEDIGPSVSITLREPREARANDKGGLYFNTGGDIPRKMTEVTRREQ